MRTKRRIRKIKTLSILPNLLTTLNLLAGFLAITSSLNKDFEKASLMIFLAIALDGLDGRIARLTKTTSNFGREYDSLSDLSSFGIAPAVFVYTYHFHSIGKWGIVPPFLYLASAALRLARFNLQSTGVEKFHFTGLPSPAGAGLIISSIMFSMRLNVQSEALLFPLTLLISFLMVSRIHFRGFKDFDPLKRLSFPFFFLLVAGTVFAIFEPVIFVFSLFSLYTLSGFIDYLRKKIIKRKSLKEVELERKDIHI